MMDYEYNRRRRESTFTYQKVGLLWNESVNCFCVVYKRSDGKLIISREKGGDTQ